MRKFFVFIIVASLNWQVALSQDILDGVQLPTAKDSFQMIQGNRPDYTPTVTAEHIFESCKNHSKRTFRTSRSLARRSSCNGFFFGVGSTMLILNQNAKLGICMPFEISTERMIKIFVDWAEDNKSKKDMQATLSVFEALKEEYPCIQSPSKPSPVLLR